MIKLPSLIPSLYLVILSIYFVSFQSQAAENTDLQSAEEIAQARAAIDEEFADAVVPEEKSLPNKTYSHLDPKHYVPADLLATAVVYFDANKGKFSNQNYITIVDFAPRSDKYRFFLVNMKNGDVERYHTSHGMGSDANSDGIAESFGNVDGSNKSSLGYVRTAEVYSGLFGPSVRLDGLSSTNSNMRGRAVVFHGWEGVKEADVVQYMSRGCITLDFKFKDAVLEKIKAGSLMYVGVSK
jgi:hypothetical protein